MSEMPLFVFGPLCPLHANSQIIDTFAPEVPHLADAPSSEPKHPRNNSKKTIAPQLKTIAAMKLCARLLPPLSDILTDLHLHVHGEERGDAPVRGLVCLGRHHGVDAVKDGGVVPEVVQSAFARNANETALS